MLRRTLQLLLFVSSALAFPVISVPGAGASVQATAPITVTWTDSGTAPADTLLTTFTLTLYVGGNVPGTDALPVGPVITAAGSVAAGTYAATLAAANLAGAGVVTDTAGNAINGFYFKMESVATEGGTVVVYSDRFSVTGLTGTTPAAQVTAAQGLTSTAGPAMVDGTANNAVANTNAGVETGMFAIPYQSQTGLTKYAPMQGLPPTKITAKTYTPLYPTSAWSTATTWLPTASIVTTSTQAVTYSVSSMENTAAAQSNPTGDMAKFLARWKD